MTPRHICLEKLRFTSIYGQGMYFNTPEWKFSKYFIAYRRHNVELNVLLCVVKGVLYTA